MRLRTAILIFDEVNALDFAGPFGVFAAASELDANRGFNVFTVAETPGSVRATGGLKLVPDFTLENAPAPQVLVVPGGAGARALLTRRSLIEWVLTRSRRAEVVLSIGSGALILGQAGLLEDVQLAIAPELLDPLRRVAPRALPDTARRTCYGSTILTAAASAAGLECSLQAVARLMDASAAQATSVRLDCRWNPQDESDSSQSAAGVRV